ncbi:MAG: phosphoribosylanthranilate isomerase [Raineya sp.]|nr:phosphoribosylanthranilate isomerase [Raineya sp.]MDW8297042.1 phosphoribosylanthranilate isomerase [Raineya sp.]
MLQWKICGMREATNICEVASLLPNFMGFIFYAQSKRYVGENWQMPMLPTKIQKVGVFVNESLERICQKAQKYQLHYLQLHGEESPEFCSQLQKVISLPIVKAFGVGKDFDFADLEHYLPFVESFLLDTQGKERGGNGIAFDWQILKKYPYSKPLWLSGGISMENSPLLFDFLKKNPQIPVKVLDLNSRFELNPALKDVKKLSTWKMQFFQPFCQNETQNHHT